MPCRLSVAPRLQRTTTLLPPDRFRTMRGVEERARRLPLVASEPGGEAAPARVPLGAPVDDGGRAALLEEAARGAETFEARALWPRIFRPPPRPGCPARPTAVEPLVSDRRRALAEWSETVDACARCWASGAPGSRGCAPAAGATVARSRRLPRVRPESSTRVPSADSLFAAREPRARVPMRARSSGRPGRRRPGSACPIFRSRWIRGTARSRIVGEGSALEDLPRMVDWRRTRAAHGACRTARSRDRSRVSLSARARPRPRNAKLKRRAWGDRGGMATRRSGAREDGGRSSCRSGRQTWRDRASRASPRRAGRGCGRRARTARPSAARRPCRCALRRWR